LARFRKVNLELAVLLKGVDTMKKISNKKTTSISGVRLISASSLRLWPWKSIVD